MKKRLIFLVIIICTLLSLSIIVSSATSKPKSTGYTIIPSEIDPTTNFFTQPLNQTKLTITDKREELINEGYVKVSETNELILYRLNKTLGIAIYDKMSGYTWYSDYHKAGDLSLSQTITSKIESGVTIEYYDANGSSISEVERSLTTKKTSDIGKTVISYEKIESGFVAHLNFEPVGISFDVEVTINGHGLMVNVPYDSIKEVSVGKLTPKNYQLKSITLFPYLGSENYQINGYAFVPDGSGALIRYTDVSSPSAALIKKVYGNDEGIFVTPEDTNRHIVKENPISLPIYGINHGYNQAAFLCEITSGDGAAELHSYPYNYSNLPINTTFFKLKVRDTFMVNLSASSMTLINDSPYPTDYALKYSFLSNDKANYVGMAKEYEASLGITNKVKEGDIPLHLTTLGLDYKPGLFGKSYIKMTSYSDAMSIVKDLNSNSVSAVQLTYLGWNKGGYFNKGAVNAVADSRLGGKKRLVKLNEFMNSSENSIDFTINPLITNTYGYGNQTVKRINLSAFNTTLKSSLEQEAYYISPSVLSKQILKKNKKYQKLKIDSLNIDHLTDTFSYRYKKGVYNRSKMIEIIENELTKLVNYRISTSNPNAYLYRYLTNYYNCEFESSKQLFETDSIPFISLILSGSVNLFSKDINYVSDYNLFMLRMIEYNIYPSFIITKKAAHNLRFTNFEYLNSTEYALWKELIISIYQNVNSALKVVRGASIIDHQYIDYGVCVVSYSNNYQIYINYNGEAYTNGEVNLEPYQYQVIGG